ncbi:MAG: Uma2 family endonuclease [Myxococcales bacterium]|nr:Uma2 family endonuclease [Myxococcales bacterium]
MARDRYHESAGTPAVAIRRPSPWRRARLSIVTQAARQRATRADLEALPEHVVGELIGGVLYTMARPRPRHAGAATVLGGDLNGAFQRGRGGPGGWWILVEPGIALPALDVDEVVPDVAGWRRSRLPELPEGSITLAPDWVCEILSPTTRSHDLLRKRPLYARAGVPWMWLVDLDARVLTASRLHEGGWLELGTWGDDAVARVEPFTAMELRLADLWGRATAP